MGMQLFSRHSLGLSLLKAGIVTPAQLEEALKAQGDNGNKSLLGQTLIRMGHCTEEQICRVLAAQAGVPFISLEQTPVDEAASHLIAPEAARRYGALPIALDDGKLMVAMKNPADIIAVDDLRMLTGYDIQPIMVCDSELAAALERFTRTAEMDIEITTDEAEFGEETSEDASTKPAVQMINLVLTQAVQAGASDVHIEPQERNSRVRFRVDGVLHDMLSPPRQLHASLVSRIKVLANMDIAERRIPQDGRMSMKIEGKTIDFRVASLPSAYGERLTLRILDKSGRIITLDQMGFPESELGKYKKIMRLPYGFIVVTGPTGSGKSTTLYATLMELNSPGSNIITLEDPIEYRLDGINQTQVNPRAGLTFANGLRSILRNDPDIVMVGEIRDEETARIAVESALTGHLVLSTLHTNDAAGAVNRLIDMGIEPFLVASSLAGIVGQRLVRLLCTWCREEYEIGRTELLESVPDFPLAPGEERVKLYRPRGCLRCGHTGYKGRMGVYELLVMSDSVRRLALEHRSTAEIKEAAEANGMISFRRDGLMKARKGITSLEEVMRVVV